MVVTDAHLIEFWGANIFDDQPFLVMPLIEGGNARDYMNHHPDCNRLKIVRYSRI
jgi:serine/threonine protein kinase